MPITLDPDPLAARVTATRPLAGLTVLVVEDSRFASEAVRLLCLKSGARIRRADSLQAAHRHLGLYSPSVIIVDIGLPDGSGLDLIKELSKAHARIPFILGTSGDERLLPEALAAGADDVLSKPLDSLGAFQNAIIQALPSDQRPTELRQVPQDAVHPENVALKDDLAHIAEVLTTSDDEHTLDYITQFLAGVARSAKDDALARAADQLAQQRSSGTAFRSDLARVAGLLEDRIKDRAAI